MAFKRAGQVTPAERDLVAKFVQDQPGDLTKKQARALATVLRRTPKTTKKLIEEAQALWVDKAARYVQIHGEATEGALKKGDHDVALKGSQWAIEHMAAAGARIVEKETKGDTGPRIQIGIKLGGIDAPKHIPLAITAKTGDV